MHLLYQKISQRWPILAIGLLLAGLWATLLIQSSATPSSEAHDRQLSYNIALPNIMAPVIRKEVHKDHSPEDERFTSACVRLPAVWQLFSVQK